MRCNFKQEIAVAPSVDELVLGRLPQWEATEHERSRIVSDLLSAILSLLADELNRFRLLESPLGDAKCGEVVIPGLSGRPRGFILEAALRELAGREASPGSRNCVCGAPPGH